MQSTSSSPFLLGCGPLGFQCKARGVTSPSLQVLNPKLCPVSWEALGIAHTLHFLLINRGKLSEAMLTLHDLVPEA